MRIQVYLFIAIGLAVHALLHLRAWRRYRRRPIDWRLAATFGILSLSFAAYAFTTRIPSVMAVEFMIDIVLAIFLPISAIIALINEARGRIRR